MLRQSTAVLGNTLRSEWNPASYMLAAMADPAVKRRAAISAFMKRTGLKVTPWEKEAGVSEGALRAFLKGRSKTITDDTLLKLAEGAGELLAQTVTVADIMGDKPSLVEIPVRSFVGAGDEIIPVPEDGPIDYVPAPPGMEDAEATEVRGRSMLPLYRDGDLLFHRRMEGDPTRYRDDVVVAQVRNGKRYVKLLLPGSKRGRFTLVSVNPAFPPLEDQLLDWVGPIDWVRKRRRS